MEYLLQCYSIYCKLLRPYFKFLYDVHNNSTMKRTHMGLCIFFLGCLFFITEYAHYDQ